MNISESIEKLGVVPVVVLNDANDAKPLAKALCEDRKSTRLNSSHAT